MREYVDSLNMHGMVLHGKGALPDADQRLLAEAIEIARDMVVADGGNATLQRFLSNILANLSDVLFQLNYNDQALTVLRQSVSVKRRLNAADAENATWEYELSVALIKLGKSQFALEKLDDSLASLEEARKRFKSLLQRDPNNALRRWSLGDCLWQMVHVTSKKGDAKAARAYAQEALAMVDELPPGDQGDDVVSWIKELKGSCCSSSIAPLR